MDIPSYLSGIIFTRATRILRANVSNALSAHNLTPTKWSFLGTVMQAPDGIRLVSVAKQLGSKAPQITAIAQELADRGFVQRLPHHSDGRAKLLIMTPQGKQFVQAVEKDVEQQLVRLLDGLTDADLLTYKKVLETIIRNGTADAA